MNISSLEFDIHLLPVQFLNISLGLISAVLNIVIILAIWKGKKLHNKCCYLIGILAGSDAAVSLCVAVNALFYSYSLFVRNELCAYNMFVSLFFVAFENGMIFIVGLDRLLAVKIPVIYKTHPCLKANVYIPFMMVLGIIFGLSHIIFAYVYSSIDVIVPICTVASAYLGGSFAYFVLSGFVLNVCTIIVYVSMYILIHKSNDSEISSFELKKKFLVSLIITMTVYICTYCLAFFLLGVMSLFVTSPSVKFHFPMYLAGLATISYGSNFFVYFIRSKEYRRAFKHLVGIKEQTTIIPLVRITRS